MGNNTLIYKIIYFPILFFFPSLFHSFPSPSHRILLTPFSSVHTEPWASWTTRMETTTITSKSSLSPTVTPDPLTPPRFTISDVGVLIGGVALIVGIIVTVFIILKRRRYRRLNGDNGQELEMENPLIPNNAESTL